MRGSWVPRPAAVPEVDPSRVSTPDELAACLDGLRRRRGLSYEAMEKTAAKPWSRSGGSRLEPLPKTTVGEIVTGKRLPTKSKLLTFLTVCEVARADLAQWLAAWERASTADLTRPAGAVRVRYARPRLLGVHESISVPGVSDEIPPDYVPRDADDGEFGVRAKIATAAERGGFVLLVGGSSVGKTRTAFEAVTALLPDWWLVHPAGTAEIAALAQAPTPRTIVWLDELQRYLGGQHGLTGGLVRALLGAPDPAVIIGTLWPDRYADYTMLPAPASADPHAREREVLDLAAVVRIGPAFSAAEQDRARVAAAGDRRLAVALEASGYGLTQTLAAAPQLVARWQDAQTAAPYAWAVLTAALDVARLGARAPLSAEFLRATAPGYCTSQQQAEAPGNWFEQAMAYATGTLHGATAALIPAGSRMGQVAGYSVADYLLQHTSRERRSARVPASIWDAAVSHIREPADATRLASSACRRLLYSYAITLDRYAAGAGDGDAAWRLADLLAQRGDLDEAIQVLRGPAGAGNEEAAWRLANLLTDLLAGQGDLDGLRARADADNKQAAWRLAALLAQHGDLDEAEQILRARADVGDGYAARRLADLLAQRGDLDEAKQILRARIDSGDDDLADLQLADLLAQHGDLDELRALADEGYGDATRRLAGLLARRGDLDEAKQILRARADDGDRLAADRLADLLAQHGDLDELRAWADDGYSVGQLAGLLARRGDLDEAKQILRARADDGNRLAAQRLADLLAQHGDLDELRAWADDGYSVGQLAGLLARRGDLDEAIQILRTQVDIGDAEAARQLPDLLAKHGRSKEAERLRRFGLNPNGSIACT